MRFCGGAMLRTSLIPAEFTTMVFDCGYNYDCSDDKRENNWSGFYSIQHNRIKSG